MSSKSVGDILILQHIYNIFSQTSKSYRPNNLSPRIRNLTLRELLRNRQYAYQLGKFTKTLDNLKRLILKATEDKEITSCTWKKYLMILPCTQLLRFYRQCVLPELLQRISAGLKQNAIIFLYYRRNLWSRGGNWMPADESLVLLRWATHVIDLTVVFRGWFQQILIVR